jgi:hypothetical protein
VNGEKKCRVNDEVNCDFKTLSMDKEAIKKRLDEEFLSVSENIKKMKKAEVDEEARKLMAVVFDKLTGIKVLRDVLQQKFGVVYFPRGRIEFMKLVLEANKNMRKFK